jgi:stage II sporulation protein AA (anti-sigma F factor antagonist)
MTVETRREKEITVAAITGRMDALTTSDVERTLMRLLDEGARTLLIDLGGLDYISSAGLRTLLAAAKRMKAQAGTMAFVNLKGHAKEVFEISGFYSLFTVYDSVESALERLGR